VYPVVSGVNGEPSTPGWSAVRTPEGAVRADAGAAFGSLGTLPKGTL